MDVTNTQDPDMLGDNLATANKYMPTGNLPLKYSQQVVSRVTAQLLATCCKVLGVLDALQKVAAVVQ